MPDRDGAKHEIVAEIDLEGGRRLTTRMVELGERCITVVTPTRSLPELDGGDRVGLVVSSEALAGPVSARGHVERVVEDGAQSRVTIHFAVEAEFQALLDSGVGVAFNRRFAYRVQPADGEPVGVTVHPAEGAPVEVIVEAAGTRPELTGRAEDISVTGVGFTIDSASAAGLSVGTRIVMVFQLPPGEDLVRISGQIRYRANTPSGQRVGADYERGTPLFEVASEAITAYVMRRQRELLRTARTVR
jgi:hypothetical protein